jgi:hypothetical protein
MPKKETRLKELQRSKEDLINKYNSLLQAQNNLREQIIQIEGRILERQELEKK